MKKNFPLLNATAFKLLFAALGGAVLVACGGGGGGSTPGSTDGPEGRIARSRRRSSITRHGCVRSRSRSFCR